MRIPGHPNRMFLIDRSRVFKSSDAGYSWYDVTPDSLRDSDDTGLHISTKNPDWMTLTGRGRTYFRSTDAGETWEAHAVADTQDGYNFYSIAFVDPDDLSLVLAYESGWESRWLIRSLDGGLTWDDDFIETFRPWYLWNNPFNASVMIAGTVDDFLSLDGGRSWSPLPADNEHNVSYSFDPNNPRIYYAHERDKTLKTINYGSTWSPVGDLPGGLKFQSFAVAPGWSDHIYGVTDEDSDTIYTSYNGGATWTEFWRIASDRTIKSISVPESEPDYPFVSVRRAGLFQFTEFDSWVSRNQGLNRTEIESLIAISADRLLVSSVGFGPLMTNNGGVSWEIPTNDSTPVCQSRTNPQVMLTPGQTGTLQRSTDGALTWHEVMFPFENPRAMAISGDANMIYASIPSIQEGDDIVKSVDGGVTWQELGQLEAPWTDGIWRGVYKIEIHPTDPDIVWVRAVVMDLQSHRAILKSTDGGVSWSVIARNLTEFEVNRADSDRMYYYVDVYRSFYRSTDGGRTWEEMENLPGSPRIEAFSSHPIDPDLLFASTSDKRILLSRDNALTWTQLAGSTTGGSLSGYRSLSVPIDDPTILYAGTGSDGILKFDISSVFSTGVESATSRELPLEFSVGDLFPNPTSHSSKLKFQLPDAQKVSVSVYDILGRRVLTVFDGFAHAGVHRREVNFDGLAPGTYYVRIKSEVGAKTMIVALVK